uniref:Uncharacterized protein n=1 Tax=Oryza punctata TaxID=4537 RepID=A0A0E0KS93_ORYPU
MRRKYTKPIPHSTSVIPVTTLVGAAERRCRASLYRLPTPPRDVCGGRLSHSSHRTSFGSFPQKRHLITKATIYKPHNGIIVDKVAVGHGSTANCFMNGPYVRIPIDSASFKSKYTQGFFLLLLAVRGLVLYMPLVGKKTLSVSMISMTALLTAVAHTAVVVRHCSSQGTKAADWGGDGVARSHSRVDRLTA